MGKRIKKGSDIINWAIILLAIGFIITFIVWLIYHGIYKDDDLDIAVVYHKLMLQQQRT